jgi:hypothetical protein
MVNTNTYNDSGNIAVFATQGGRDNVTIFGPSPTLFLGNTFGSGYGYLAFSGSKFSMSTPSVTLSLNVNASDKITLTDTTAAYGNNSSFSHTYNGSTFTYAHLASINTDVLKIGAAGSTLTNGTSFVTLGTYNGVTPGNMLTNVASSADGAISWSGQGTRIMTPAINYGIIVTNGMTANMGNATNYSGANLKFNTTYTTGLVYSVAASDSLVACISTGQAVRVMLPTSGSTGRRIGVIKTDESGFSVIVDAGSSKNINGSTNFLLNVKYQPVEFTDTGTEWFAK